MTKSRNSLSCPRRRASRKGATDQRARLIEKLHFVQGYWFAPDHQKTGPGLLEDKRLPLRRFYSYRIKSDYDAISVDENNLADLLQTVKHVIDIIDEKGGG